MENKEKLKFISSFSSQELGLNGHYDLLEKEKILDLLNLFDSFVPFIRGGDYLELGCGTGILCRYLYLCLGGKIKVHGVDLRSDLIKLARKNNPKFEKNFVVGDYYKALGLKDLKKFSTINIFVEAKENEWDKILNLIISFLRIKNDLRLIVSSYDNDLRNYNDKSFLNFLNCIKEIAKVSLPDPNFIVIGEWGRVKQKMNKQKQKKESLKFNKKIVEGGVIKRDKNSLLLEVDKKEEKVFLSPETLFLSIKISESGKFSDDQSIKTTDLKKGDSVVVYINEPNEEKNFASVVKKIVSV